MILQTCSCKERNHLMTFNQNFNRYFARAIIFNLKSPQAKKSLGQHFLHDENISQRIVNSIVEKLPGSNNVLEIGPGPGALTKFLLKQNLNLRCVELDERMIEHLLKTYPASKDKIIHGDFLSVKLNEVFKNEFSIVGNFPYNISSQILFRILEERKNIPLMVGMFQKEVGDRIASIHGNKTYGILSVLVQAYYDVENLFIVEPTSFTPPPKVKSVVLRLMRKKNSPEFVDEKYFFAFVKNAFGQRRKTLRNSLSQLIPKEKLQDKTFDKRAEQLSVQQFIELANQFAVAEKK